MTPSGFVRPSLRDALIVEIEQRVLDGSLMGELRETDLALELGVSRTPVREALIALERDGLIDATPGRGFRVPPLTASDLRETYSLLGALESAALCHSPLPPPRDWLRELLEINRALEQACGDPRSVVTQDTRWHSLLIGRTANNRILILARRARTQLRRYEFAYLSDTGSVQQSVSEHAGIIEALRKSRIEDAVDRLNRHWCFGVGSIPAGLRED